MKNDRLASFEELGGSVELLVADRSTRVNHVYRVVLLLVIAALVSLPIVRVAVSVPTAGIVRPILEKQAMRARTSAFIREVRVANNQSVRLNDTLVILDDKQLTAQERVLLEQIRERENLVRDFETLLAGVSTSLESVALLTPQGASERSRYRAERRRLQLAADEAARQRELTRAMARTPGVVSADEVRRRETEAEQSESELGLQTERTTTDWTSRLRSERDNIRDFRNRLAELGQQRSLYVIRSPVEGTAEQVISMSPGGFVQAGDELLQISPETQIAAEMQVSARDIGLLTVGMPARMMIDAFDYNSWGVATGSIVSISHDAAVVDNQAVYFVRCSIDQPELTLKNGYRGRIQKGMTFQARFLVAERSLFNLMYDRVDSWLNPSRTPPRVASRPPNKES